MSAAAWIVLVGIVLVVGGLVGSRVGLGTGRTVRRSFSADVTVVSTGVKAVDQRETVWTKVQRYTQFRDSELI